MKFGNQTSRVLFGAFVLSAAMTGAAHSDEITRQVTFKLSYANRDLIWLGDPASPTALVYIRPGARPIATDVCVTTLATSHAAGHKRYLREARLVDQGHSRAVHAFTDHGEKIIGTVDAQGCFTPNEAYRKHRKLLPSWPSDPALLIYDPQEDALYYEVDVPGPVVVETLDFLPLELTDAQRKPIAARFAIDVAASGDADHQPVVRLALEDGNDSRVLAQARLPKVFRRSDVQLGSFDNQTGTYLREADYRPGALDQDRRQPSVTFSFAGQFTDALQAQGPALVVDDPPGSVDRAPGPARITIDGRFDDWRNVPGVDDPRGDVVPYLEYLPDVDLLEFKVAHDDQHIYLYARVAGQVGRTHPEGGRSYFYAYMDVDQNPNTGFLPTRDDNCYFGVEIGDDCEVQFEFVNNALRKTFYGFCGLGGDENVLRQVVTIGKSQYGRFDERGVERANYKSEYIYRDGITEITEDLKLGTSDTIRVALAPDGSEVEISSTFTGFLKDAAGRPIVGPGQTIDLAAGMESDSKAYPGKTRWGADSTPPIRGYRLGPAEH
jgi:hypothetical protein